MKYLKDEQHYIDLYDLHTIKDCLWSTEFWRNAFKEKANNKSATNKEKVRAFAFGLNVDLYVRKTERYRNRKKTISEWLEKDRGRDEKLENTPIPQNILCPSCNLQMKMESKHLDIGFNEPDRVEFFFACFPCRKNRIIYDSGEEQVSKPRLCTKCQSELKVSYSENRRVVTWVIACSSCDFNETDIDDFDKKDAERKKEEQENKQLLQKYRSEFCLSDEEGQKHVSWLDRLIYLMDSVEKDKQKKADPNYQKATQLKRLSVVELEKLLNETLEKEKYIKLVLDKPEIGKYVIVPFTVQEADSSRVEYDSTHRLQKLIKKTLEDSNWRLMSEGVILRLGYLSGRLKGYEREDDLTELMKNEKIA